MPSEGQQLLPCPFCGDTLIEVAGDEWGEDFRATCIGCLAKSGRYRTRPEAVKAWNTRAPATTEARAGEKAPQTSHKWAERVGQHNNDPLWGEIRDNVEQGRVAGNSARVHNCNWKGLVRPYPAAFCSMCKDTGESDATIKELCRWYSELVTKQSAAQVDQDKNQKSGE